MIKSTYLITFIITLLLSNAFAQGKVKKSELEEAKWNKVLKLLADEKKTIKMLGVRSVAYKHRLFEIDTEYIKITRAKEHNKFFADAQKGKLAGTKDFYYRNSRKLFINTQKKGQFIVKNYPKYPRLAEVLYTMGLNERDYNNSKWSKHYFLQARKKSGSDYLTNLLDVQLAEYFYNKKEYEVAAKYYKMVVNNKDDKWLAKHMYNYAWCTFKLKDYNNALVQLNAALDLGKKKEYEAVTEQIFEAAISFYVYSKKIKSGVQFFEKGEITKSDKFEWLLKFSKKSAEKGFFEESMYVYQKAYSYANEEQKNILLLDKLAFFRNFKNEQKYKETVSDIVKRKKTLKKEEKESFVAEVLNFSGFKQRALQQSHNKMTGKYSKANLTDTLFYFDSLIKMDRKSTDQYRYFQGETLFGVNEFAQSAKYYLGALKASIKRTKKEKVDTKNKELQDKIFNALFSVMRSPQLPANKRDRISFFVYKSYIDENPKNKKSVEVYKALFDLSIDKKKENFAKNSLFRFRKNHPSFIAKQKEMYFYLFDTGIVRKKSDFVAQLIKDMDKFKLTISKSEKKTAIASLGSLVFNEIEKSEKDSKTSTLVDKYSKLHSNKLYPEVIRANSAFKLAQFYADKFETQNSYKWTLESLTLYNAKEINTLRSAFKNKIYLFMELQDFEMANKMVNTYNKHYCLVPGNEINEIASVKVSINQVLNEEIDTYFGIKNYQKCGLSNEKVEVLKGHIVTHLLDTYETEKVFDLLKRDKVLTSDHIISHFYQNYWNDNKKSLSFDALKLLKTRSHRAFQLNESIVTYNRMKREINKLNFVELSKVITKENFETKLGEFIGQNIEINTKMVEIFNKNSSVLHDRAKLDILKVLGEKNIVHQKIIDTFTIEEMDAETMKVIKGELEPILVDLKKQSSSYELQSSNIRNSSLEMFTKSPDLKLYKLSVNGGV